MSDRMETGPVRFGENDWAGVFIRGDNCFGYVLALQNLMDGIGNHLDEIGLQNLLRVLKSCDERCGRVDIPVAKIVK